MIASEPSFSSTFLDTDDRPEALKGAIAQSFDQLQSNPTSCWSTAGREVRPYHCCLIEEDKLIALLIQQKPKQTFWILDAGTGCFKWGEYIANYLNKLQIFEYFDIRIVGVTAEGNKNVSINKIGCCKLYYFARFPLEDIKTAWGAYIESLQGEGFESIKFDFVISRSTFQHLEDPFGTFVDVYNLMQPNGVFVGDFPFRKGGYFFQISLSDLLIHSGVDFFCGPASMSLAGDCYGVCVRKMDDNPLQLLAAYSDFLCQAELVVKKYVGENIHNCLSLFTEPQGGSNFLKDLLGWYCVLHAFLGDNSESLIKYNEFQLYRYIVYFCCNNKGISLGGVESHLKGLVCLIDLDQIEQYLEKIKSGTSENEFLLL